MPKQVTLTIDGQEITVPEGTLIVDAARKMGIDIPVFCFHPKMEPVGMCRMCLVEIGRPILDRATGQFQRDADGAIKITFGPKLETACTTPVSEAMMVLALSDAVKAARKDVVEFILTSHPLDCPVCDKGGECPLQNLTMRYGSGQSRFVYDEKIHLEKHVPLGDLIYLDRERCIQCARCVRFQEKVADDPVIGFYRRGRSLEIRTYSEPGFDSYFSGNTTDICPVGALTTVDFHFGARPWELMAAASLCTHCPVGCNITYNVRREAGSAGKMVIKRAMPRQNEAVNEIWMCDKGRFGYHFTESDQRLTQPLIRQDGQLVPTTWEAALQLAASHIKDAGSDLLALAGGRLANEDLYQLSQLAAAQGGRSVLYSAMGGGDLTARYGLSQGSNLGDLGKTSAILVVACDLEEEAPIWWLRVKQAAERGAALVVVNPRDTKLDRVATHSLRYAYGAEVNTIKALAGAAVGSEDGSAISKAAKAFAQAENSVVFFGSEGLGLPGSKALAQACADLLVATGHTGKPNNGLVGVWSAANTQGAWDMGFRPDQTLADSLEKSGAVLVAAADPAGDNPVLAAALEQAGFVVVQELFLTETAKRADVVLPVQAYTEREGTFTSGERRVQRYFPAVPPRPGGRADFVIIAQLAHLLGLTLAGSSASSVFAQAAGRVPAYAGLSYQTISQTAPQWPDVGRNDVNYAGTIYDNTQGLGCQLPLVQDAALATTDATLEAAKPVQADAASASFASELDGPSLLAVPVTRLYDRGQTLLPTTLLHRRLAKVGMVFMNPSSAADLNLADGKAAIMTIVGATCTVQIALDPTVPQGVVLAPRSVGLPVTAPVKVRLAPQD